MRFTSLKNSDTPFWVKELAKIIERVGYKVEEERKQDSPKLYRKTYENAISMNPVTTKELDIPYWYRELTKLIEKK